MRDLKFSDVKPGDPAPPSNLDRVLQICPSLSKEEAEAVVDAARARNMERTIAATKALIVEMFSGPKWDEEPGKKWDDPEEEGEPWED
jgi:hypothetical protein